MIKVIPISQLRVGMYVSEQNSDWVPDTNRTKSGLILKQETIEKIRRRGILYVTIDAAKGVDVEPAVESNSPQKSDQLKARIIAQQEQSGVASPSASLEDERRKATEIHTEALNLINDVMEKVKAGTEINVKDVENVAEDIVQSVYRNENALACMSRIRDKDAYLMEHSLNVGILMSILGKSMGYSHEDIRTLAVGGMLHDVGKIQVPDSVLHKPGKLEAMEWEEMKRHVTYGEAYLRTLEIDPDVITVCAQHHERLDGTGYPLGLGEKDISVFGRIAAVCDVYDAITADRVYHQGMTPSVAMKKLVEWSDYHLDRKLVYQFIRAMSIYPVGTVVELNTEQLAIVVEPNRVQQAQPVVRSIYSTKSQRYIAVNDIDLAHSKDVEILRAIDPARLNFPLKIMDFM